MSKEDPKIVEVEIFKETYKIVNDTSPEHTQSIAKHVDQKMKEISKNAPPLASGKIAVLAALNIADELFKVTKEMEADKETVEKETNNLCRLISGSAKS